MKKATSLIVVISLFLTASSGQSNNEKKKPHPGGKTSAISLGANIPAGVFNDTHIIGLTTEYAWSNQRFGKMDIKSVKSFGFTANAGISYYFGKKETAAGYVYKYPGYLFLHSYAGIIYNPWKKGNVNLSLGPAVGFYNGNTRFNIGGKLEGTYYPKEKLGISPAILMMKEHGTNELWAISFKSVYCF